MSHYSRKPPITVTIDKNIFNNLMEILSSNEDYYKYREKLLRYSMLSNDRNYIEMSFYIDEAKDFMFILCSNLRSVEPELNYYNVLLNIRNML